MIVSYFDIIVAVVILLINFLFWKRKISLLQKIIWVILVAIVLPLLSINFEFRSVKQTENFDALTMAYTFLKFPLYWFIALIRSILFLLKKNGNSILQS